MTGAASASKGAELTRQLLAETREELHRADSKAAMLFAIFGVVVGVVLAGIVAGDWHPDSMKTGAEVVWWSGASASIAALVLLAAAVWPRLASRHVSGRVTYFGHVVAYSTRDSLRTAIERQADHDIDRPLEQLQAVSRIVVRKYQLIRGGMVVYGAGATACAVACLM